MAKTRIPGPALDPDPLAEDSSNSSLRRSAHVSRLNGFVHHLVTSKDPYQEPGHALAALGPCLFLFTTGNSPVLGISDDDYQAAADELKVDIEAILAVSEVESKQSPFDGMGRPTIIFERHVFHDLTFGEFDQTHPHISNRTPSYVDHSYGKLSAQYNKLWDAYRLDAASALRASSWGRFQILGKNHDSVGYATVFDFVLAMCSSELAHLKSFVRFVKSSSAIHNALKNHDWKGFALRYNGKDYQRTHYDLAMQNAYDRIVKRRKAATGGR